MRRTLFGKSPELKRLSPARASAREALTFDILDHESSADQTLIERRVGSWALAPWLLLAGHAIITASLLMQDRPPFDQRLVGARFMVEDVERQRLARRRTRGRQTLQLR